MSNQPDVTAYDSETHLIARGMPSPQLVCGTFARPGDDVGEIYLREQTLDKLETMLGQETLAGHNMPYDLGVAAAERPATIMPKIFTAIDRGKIECTMHRQMMIDNATGELKFIWDEEKEQFKKQNFSLQKLVYRMLGIYIPKGQDTWRLRYNELDDRPLEEWPKPAIDYAIKDSILTRDLRERQHRLVQPEGIPGENSQIEAAWALQLMHMWGVRTDPVRVSALKERLSVDFAAQQAECVKYGFVREKKGTKDLKKIRAAIESWYKANPDHEMLATPKGDIATSRKQLTTTNHPGLQAVAEANRIGKLLKTYVPVLERGIHVPINARYNTILETFRTSCGDPNLQNPPRFGGVRECFVARPGYVFVFCDYDTLEMRTLAQVCIDLFGFSDIADAIKQNKDLHCAMAANMLRLPYLDVFNRYENGDPEIENARQYCFHPDTDALTPTGWKKISDLDLTDLVAAAIPENDGVRIEWQRPTALTRRPAKELVHLQCEGIDLRVTKDHRMLAYRTDGGHEETTPLELPKKRGWYNAGIAPGGEWDPDEKLLRLAVATQADGSYAGHQIKLGFTKQRKIDRMRELLVDVPHRESVSSQGATEFFVFGDPDYRSGPKTPPGIAAEIKAFLTDKCFDERWIALSSRARRIVLDEARHWDSSCNGRSVSYTFMSTIKKNAEILQIVATLEGRKTRLVPERYRCSEGEKVYWQLTVRDSKTRKNDRSRGDNLKADVIPHDGDVVCLSVPSSYVVVRDAGVVVISGQCKIANYGMAGGMGPDAFVSYAEGYGIKVARPHAESLRDGFKATWSEMPQYFNHCGWLCRDGSATIEFVRTGMFRGGVGYTQACNGFFQHIAAMGAKTALYQTAKECYNDAGSPLYGCRPWLFAHDEIGMEVPIAAIGPKRTHEAAMRLQQVMIESMKIWCPDVPIGASPAMTRNWWKGAKPVYQNGVMVPSKPEKRGDKKVWVHDA